MQTSAFFFFNKDFPLIEPIIYFGFCIIYKYTINNP